MIWRTCGARRPASRLSSPFGRFAWTRWSAASPGLKLAQVFQHSRDHGLVPQNLARIAREWAPQLGLEEADIVGYLTENIHYYLDRENHSGFQLFLRYAREIGLIPPCARRALSRPGGLRRQLRLTRPQPRRDADRLSDI